MAKDLTDTLGHAVGRLARETAQSVTSNARKASKSSPLSGPKGLAAGAGLVALAPLAAKGAGKLVKGQLAGGENPLKKAKDAVSGNPVEKAKEAVGGNLKDAVGSKIDEAGGASGLAKEAGKGLIPGMGGDDDGDGGGNKKKQAGAQIGNTRRMPIQQFIDVAVPIETAYNQWTQFEEWPNFMHRLDNVSQEDETTVKFKAKFWGISREFTAEIVEQRPDERIKWEVTEGVQHTGVVTFHKLADRLTRVDVDVDIQPGSLLEKAGRGMRHAKRGIRADLSRFKAYIELEEEESGEWRGEIDDGDVKSTRASSSGSSRGSSEGSSSGSSSRGRSRSAAPSSGGSSRSARSSGSSGSGSSRRSSGGSSSGSSSRGRSRSAAASSGGSSRAARSSGSSGSSKSSGRSSSGSSKSSGRSSGSSSKASGGSSSGRSSGSSKSSGQSSGSSSRASGRSSGSSSKASGRSSGSSSKASGRSSGSRASGSSSGRSSGSSSGRSSGSSSGSSNGSTRSSRAKSSSNGASASRSTKRKTASSRS